MKFFHELEDCVVGIIAGVIVIGLSGYYFQLPQADILWGFLLGVSALFTIFDMIKTISDLGDKILPLAILFLNNMIDIILETALAAKYLGFYIPFISDLIEPFLEDPFNLLLIGIFFIASSIFWAIASPIIWREPKAKPVKLKK